MPLLNGKIDLFQSLKLDKGYKNVLRPMGYTARDEIFDQRVYKTLDNQSYSKRENGYVRVSLGMNTCKSVTYLRFLNPNYEDRYIYCFVDSVEYVNDGTTDIHFTVDVFTTYCGSLNILPCYVEREHSVTDVAGDHTLGEPVPMGNTVSISSQDTVTYLLNGGDRLKNQLIICTTFDSNGVYKAGQYRDGVYGGCFIKVFPANTVSDATAINKWLTAVTDANLMDGIVNMFLVSDVFNIVENPITVSENENAPIKVKANFGSGPMPNGYTPKNKKLYTYPYNYLVASDGTSDGIYRYELSSNKGIMYFALFCSINNGMPAFSLVPYGYNGGDENPMINFESGSLSANFDDRIDMNLYTPVSINVDSFKAWLAQNMGGAVPIFQAGATLATGVASGNVLGTVLNLGNQALNFAQQTTQPPTSKGASCGNVMAMTKHLLPFFIQKCIDANHARMIDDFFTMFGYQCNRVKTPNVSSRPHWNYVKTANSLLSGNIPKADLETMQNAFNNGITFWDKLENIGNYDLNNQV